jgi:hypothetical protein
MKKLLLLTLSALLVTGTLTSCDEQKTIEEVVVTGVSLDKTTLSLVEGSSATLTATIVPAEAANKRVTWKSSASDVASVDAEGKVTAVKAGTATITVTTADGAKTATCAVTVEANVVPVTGVSLNKTILELGEGQSETLSATVTPENASNKDVAWSSSDAEVATVDTAGKVTALKAGSATITVTTADGGKTASCAVTVIQNGSYSDGQVITYLKSDKAKDVPLIFMGDGFTSAQMGFGGRYEQVMTAFVAGLFDVEPFKSYKEYFSVYIVVAVSNEEGVATPDHPVDNVFDTRIEYGSINANSDAMIRYAEKVEFTGDVGAVVLLGNSIYGFGTSNADSAPVWRNGAFARVCAMQDGHFDIPAFIHELAHAFAYLSDEYLMTDEEPTESDKQGLAEQHAKGQRLNLSYTDDPARVPWAHLLNHPNYSYVGIIEGAIHSTGAWRSEGGGIMNSIVDYPEYGVTGPYFNAISREMIVKRIKAMAGEEYSFDEFVAKDKYEPNLDVSWWGWWR